MTRAGHDPTVTAKEVSCYCECERCVLLALSKLGPEKLPVLSEPKFRRCQPCKLKYDLILKRQPADNKEPKQNRQAPMAEPKPLTAGHEEAMPEEGTRFDELPAPETPKKLTNTPKTDIEAKLKQLELSSQFLLEPAITKESIVEPRTPKFIRKRHVPIEAQPAQPSTPSSPKALNTDRPKPLEDSANELVEIQEQRQEPAKPQKIEQQQEPVEDHIKVAGDEPQPSTPMRSGFLTDSRAQPSSIRKPETGEQNKPASSRMAEKTKKTASHAKTPGRKQDIYSIGVGSKAPRVTSPNAKKAGNTLRCTTRTRKRHVSKAVPKHLESLSSNSVEELLSRDRELTLRKTPSSKWSGRKLGSRSSASDDARPPWFPVRTSNRWESYDKVEKEEQSRQEREAKLSKAKPKRKSSGGAWRNTGMKPINVYAVVPTVGRRLSKKSSIDSEPSSASSKNGFPLQLDDKSVYYKLTGVMRPHLPNKPARYRTPTPHVTAKQSKVNSRRNSLDSSDLCLSCRAASSEAEVNSYVSEASSSEQSAYDCPCNCNRTENDYRQHLECQCRCPDSASDEYNASSCDECGVEYESQPEQLFREEDRHVICISDLPFVKQVIEQEHSDSIGLDHLCVTSSPPCHCCEQEIVETQAIEPCCVNELNRCTQPQAGCTVCRENCHAHHDEPILSQTPCHYQCGVQASNVAWPPCTQTPCHGTPSFPGPMPYRNMLINRNAPRQCHM